MPNKICIKCESKVHSRLKVCKCGYKFSFKFKRDNYKSIKWQDLKKGDQIKVSGGPFWVNSNKEKVLMGYKGRFNVLDLDENGILAYSTDRGGFCHIWMKNKIITKDGITKMPHKIKKINIKH
jgi:hypothetical protein